MEELIFGGQKFISSRRASKVTGYSTDYIGQLCRANKIKGRLVGRSWYVSEDAVASHVKSTKRRQVSRHMSEAFGSLSYYPETSRSESKNSVLYHKEDAGALVPEPVRRTVRANTDSGIHISRIDEISHKMVLKNETQHRVKPIYPKNIRSKAEHKRRQKRRGGRKMMPIFLFLMLVLLGLGMFLGSLIVQQEISLTNAKTELTSDFTVRKEVFQAQYNSIKLKFVEAVIN
jgi:hypothetical protein